MLWVVLRSRHPSLDHAGGVFRLMGILQAAAAARQLPANRRGSNLPAVRFSSQARMTSTPPVSKHARTKIVATLGPASADPEMLRNLVVEGVDVFRLNMAHGTRDEHE